MNDKELNNGLQDNIALKLMCDDESAIEDILKFYAPKVQNSLLRKYEGIVHEVDMEDIMSQAIMNLWVSRSTYDDKKSSVRSWLYTIANNLIKDIQKQGWHKAMGLEKIVEQEFLGQSTVIEKHPNQSTVVDCKKDDKKSAAVNRVLRELPEVQREILIADSFADDDVADSGELGGKLGYPATTIRVYRNRAKEAFRKNFKQLGYDLEKL